MKKVVTYTDFVEKLKEIFKKGDIIYLPTSDYIYKKANVYEDFTNIPFRNIRMMEPIKTFFFKPKENVLKIEDNYIGKSLFLVGIKSCDISAIRTLDNIFMMRDYKDEHYSYWRSKSIIISSDCPNPGKNCFCKNVNINPYPTDGFDINISFIDENNFMIESGSVKGEEIIKEYFIDFEEPTKDDMGKRDGLRILSERKLRDINKEYLDDINGNYYNCVKNGYDLNDTWKKESLSCVQCHGCNYICPSCYCFLIRENSKSFEKQVRDKVWDACHSTGYGRVAGGANPRKYKYQRFRNRYECKFVYRKENFSFYACTGCGRCIEVCPGKIDIRKVVTQLCKVGTQKAIN